MCLMKMKVNKNTFDSKDGAVRYIVNQYCGDLKNYDNWLDDNCGMVEVANKQYKTSAVLKLIDQKRYVKEYEEFKLDTYNYVEYCIEMGNKNIYGIEVEYCGN